MDSFLLNCSKISPLIAVSPTSLAVTPNIVSMVSSSFTRQLSSLSASLYQLVRDRVTLETLPALAEAELGRYLDFSAGYASLTVQQKGAVMATLPELLAAYPALA